MSLQIDSYPIYRELKIAWLDRIPHGWSTSGLGKCILFARNGCAANQGDEGPNSVRVTRIETISTGHINLDAVGYARSYDVGERYRLLKGDIQFSNINSLSMIGNCALFDDDTVLFAGMNLLQIRPNPKVVSPRFLHWQLRSKWFRNQVEASAKPAINQASIPVSSLRQLPVMVPPLEEQTQIAKFLDYETAKIDALIAKQQQLIALLQEKRQAVISHVVTKGLNPAAPLRDSGVAWLGQVPAHWEVVRLKHTCEIQLGMAKGKPASSTTVDMPMLRVANVQDGWLNLDDVHQIPVERSQVTRYLLRNGDVLMNEGGDRDKLGRGTIWRGEVPNCIHQNHVFAIRPHSIEPEWLDAVTRADYAKFYFYQVAKQSTNLASISSSNIMETPLVVPPFEERWAILDHIRQMSAKNSSTIDLAERQVELLQERRTALISAAVTGKIDVRGWQPPSAAAGGFDEPHGAKATVLSNDAG